MAKIPNVQISILPVACGGMLRLRFSDGNVLSYDMSNQCIAALVDQGKAALAARPAETWEGMMEVLRGQSP